MITASLQVRPTKKPTACSRYTTMARVFKLFSSLIDHDPLLPRFEPCRDPHAALAHLVVRGQKLDQRLVRLAVHGARREAHLDALAVHAGELRARSARLHVKLQDQSAATITDLPLQGAGATPR